MEFKDVIEGRESIRNYDPDRPINEAVLRRILEAGRIAPSAANRQPWTFLLISSTELKTKINACYPKDWFRDAPHILMVKGNRDQAWTSKFDGRNALETDLTIAMDHMILAAENEGVGTCWIAAFDTDLLRQALPLQKHEQIFAITPLGYPRAGFEKKRLKQRKSFDEIVRFL